MLKKGDISGLLAHVATELGFDYAMRFAIVNGHAMWTKTQAALMEALEKYFSGYKGVVCNRTFVLGAVMVLGRRYDDPTRGDRSWRSFGEILVKETLKAAHEG